ncbi:hypothetical protein [Exiguobacterium sp. s7]|uniref:hypothetical protein n=1 Tax=Exiguobacterium sp. s7 TaxID=2751235 RepID=UPI001BE5BDBC|nr:hypothetical protein [Exiguobacterium sp. s7]
MIVIKINKLPTSKEELKERTRRAWKRNIRTLTNETELITLYKGKIVGVFTILGIKQDELEPNRVAFVLSEKSSPLVGKNVHYSTSNPCTVIDINQLRFT